MIVNWELKSGLVLGLEADSLHLVYEDDEVAEEPTPVIYLHLFVLTLAFIFD